MSALRAGVLALVVIVVLAVMWRLLPKQQQ